MAPRVVGVEKYYEPAILTFVQVLDGFYDQGNGQGKFLLFISDFASDLFLWPSALGPHVSMLLRCHPFAGRKGDVCFGG